MNSTKKSQNRKAKNELSVQEPSQPQLLLTCPSHLSPRAREEWDWIMLELPQHVCILNLDRTMLALYCDATAQYWEATEAIKKTGAVLMTPNGHPMQSPYVGIAHHYSTLLIKLASELGLSPASRRRLPSPISEVRNEYWGLPPLRV